MSGIIYNVKTVFLTRDESGVIDIDTRDNEFNNPEEALQYIARAATVHVWDGVMIQGMQFTLTTTHTL